MNKTIVVKGRTLRETLEKSLDDLLNRIKHSKQTIGSKKEKFEVKCTRMEVCIKRFLRKILRLAKNENFIPFNVSFEIIPRNGKWSILVSLELEKKKEVLARVNRIEDVLLEENRDGWRIKITYV